MHIEEYTLCFCCVKYSANVNLVKLVYSVFQLLIALGVFCLVLLLIIGRFLRAPASTVGGPLGLLG